jgi:ElaB/YqjD/DUF883 family membrane-anchored ribosome-binding protein
MSIGSKASNGAEAAREAVHHAGEHIDQATRNARKHAGEAYDAAEGYVRSAGRYARDNPVQAVLIGLGGVLLASLLFRRR